MARQFLTMKYHYKATDKEKKLLKLLYRISKNENTFFKRNIYSHIL